MYQKRIPLFFSGTRSARQDKFSSSGATKFTTQNSSGGIYFRALYPLCTCCLAHFPWKLSNKACEICWNSKPGKLYLACSLLLWFSSVDQIDRLSVVWWHNPSYASQARHKHEIFPWVKPTAVLNSRWAHTFCAICLSGTVALALSLWKLRNSVCSVPFWFSPWMKLLGYRWSVTRILAQGKIYRHTIFHRCISPAKFRLHFCENTSFWKNCNFVNI